MTQCCQCDGVTPPPAPSGACCHDCGTSTCTDYLTPGDCLVKECSSFFLNQTCAQITCPDAEPVVCCRYDNPVTGASTKLGCIVDDGHPDERLQDCIAAGFTSTNAISLFSNIADCNTNCVPAATTTSAPLGRCCICRTGANGKYYRCVENMTFADCMVQGDCTESSDWALGSNLCVSLPCPTTTTLPPIGCCLGADCVDALDCASCEAIGGVCLETSCNAAGNSPCVGACCSFNPGGGYQGCEDSRTRGSCQNIEHKFHQGASCGDLDCSSTTTTTSAPTTTTTTIAPDCPDCLNGPLENCGKTTSGDVFCLEVGGCKMVEESGERLECCSTFDGSVVEVFCNAPVGCCCCCPELYEPCAGTTTTTTSAPPTTTTTTSAPTTTPAPFSTTTTLSPPEITTTACPCQCPDTAYLKFGLGVSGDCDYIFTDGGVYVAADENVTSCTQTVTYTKTGAAECGDEWTVIITCDGSKLADDPERWSHSLETCQGTFTNDESQNPDALGACAGPPSRKWSVTATDTDCPCCANSEGLGACCVRSFSGWPDNTVYGEWGCTDDVTNSNCGAGCWEMIDGAGCEAQWHKDVSCDSSPCGTSDDSTTTTEGPDDPGGDDTTTTEGPDDPGDDSTTTTEGPGDPGGDDPSDPGGGESATTTTTPAPSSGVGGGYSP